MKNSIFEILCTEEVPDSVSPMNVRQFDSKQFYWVLKRIHQYVGSTTEVYRIRDLCIQEINKTMDTIRDTDFTGNGFGRKGKEKLF